MLINHKQIKIKLFLIAVYLEEIYSIFAIAINPESYKQEIKFLIVLTLFVLKIETYDRYRILLY